MTQYVASVTAVLFFSFAALRSGICYLCYVDCYRGCAADQAAAETELPSCGSCGSELPPDEMRATQCGSVDAESLPICSLCIVSEPTFTERCENGCIPSRLLPVLEDRRLTGPDKPDGEVAVLPTASSEPKTHRLSLDGRPCGVHRTIATTVLRL
jgi:hypothetical protein